MADFVRGDCHKCKYETSAECVPRSQKIGFPNCYQSTTTNADCIRGMTDEELADFISGKARTFGEEYEGYMSALDWLREAVQDV